MNQTGANRNGDVRPGAPLRRPGEAALVALGLAWILLAAFWSAPGMFTGDDFAYRAMVDAFARNGTLTVENGYETYGTDALALRHMRIVGGAITPQYPSGWAILAAPAYALAGVRGVIMMNAIAAALTLGLVWLSARALFDDRRLAVRAALIWGLCSYIAEYALGFWPHAPATLMATAALAAVAVGWRNAGSREGRSELRGAFLAGLALGLAIQLRVDALITALPVAVWLLGTARRPYLALALLAAGLVPGLAASAAINHAKFGTFSPLSYGASGGAASLGYYAGLLPLAAVGGALALSLGLAPVRRVIYRPAAMAAVVVGLAALCTLVPVLRELGQRIAWGAWVLVGDFQSHPLPSWGLAEGPDGTIRMQGLVKKALVQSMPYAPLVLLLVPGLFRGPMRAPLGLCFLATGLGILPFAYGSWHGGMANNMRYFLNFLPMVAILTAVALDRVPAPAGWRIPAFGAFAAIGASAILWAIYRAAPLDAALLNILPNIAAGAVTALTLALMALPRGAGARIAGLLRGAVALGLVSAFASSWLLDLQFTQQIRLRNAQMETLTADLPPDALVVTFAASAAGFRVNRPPALTAETERVSMGLSPALQALVARAFAEGRPVFAQGRELVAAQMVRLGIARDPKPRYGIDERFDLYEMSPPAG